MKNIALIIALALLASPAHAATHDRMHRVEGLGGAVESASAEFGIDPMLLLAVIEVESMYRPQAVSSVGARGLMQVKPSTAKWIAKKTGLPQGDLFDVAYNVRIGTAYLNYLIDRFGDYSHAVMAYNLGPNALAKRISRGETLPDTYVGKVGNTYQDLLEWNR
jgi:soluble lytic murein transglycosylase